MTVPANLLPVATIVWSKTITATGDNVSHSRVLVREREEKLTITDGPVYSVEGDLANTVLLRYVM